MNRLGLKDLFHAHGRINRMDFFTGGALLAIAAVSLGFGVGTLLGMVDVLPTPAVVVVQLLISVPLIYGQFCVTAKRLHDVNMPAALATMGFVELMFTLYVGFAPPAFLPGTIEQNISLIDNVLMATVVVFNLGLLFLPGTPGENRYGSRPTAERLPKARDLQG